jgi:hypothetical protein
MWLLKIFLLLNESQNRGYILPKIPNKVTGLTNNLAATQRIVSRAWHKTCQWNFNYNSICTPILLPFMPDFCRALVYCFSLIFFFSKISVNIYKSLNFGLIYAFITQKFSQIFYRHFLYQHIFCGICCTCLIPDVHSTILAKYFAIPVHEIILFFYLRSYDSCRRLPEPKHHSFLINHWSASRCLVSMVARTPSIHVFLDVLFFFFLLVSTP